MNGLIILRRSASEGNEQHDTEISSTIVTAEQDVAKDNEGILELVDSKCRSP